jgi:hypothetical protein
MSPHLTLVLVANACMHGENCLKARPVLNGGREETCRKVTRLAPTQRNVSGLHLRLSLAGDLCSASHISLVFRERLHK